MEVLSRLVKTLPSLRTPIQLTGLIVLVSAVVVMRIVAPEQVTAHVTAGGIGILFIIFGQLFHFLHLIPESQRAVYVLAMFFGFLVFIVVLVVLTVAQLGSAGSGSPNAFAVGEGQPLELVSQRYDAGTLTYDLIVNNNSQSVQLLLLAGVTTETQGQFGCTSRSGTLLSVASYELRFHVAARESVQKLDPPLVIGPGDPVRFTVTLVPGAHGACFPWTSTVTLFVQDDSGRRLQASAVTITSGDIGRLERVALSVGELLGIARSSRDAVSRAEALSRLTELPSQKLDERQTSELVALATEALGDLSPTVRAAAASALGQVGGPDRIARLADLLRGDKDDGVRREAARVLGNLMDAGAVDSLGFALKNDSSVDVQLATIESLGRIGDRRAEVYLLDAWGIAPGTHAAAAQGTAVTQATASDQRSGAAPNPVAVQTSVALRSESVSRRVADAILVALVQVRSEEAEPIVVQALRSVSRYGSRGSIVVAVGASEPAYAARFAPVLLELLASDPDMQYRYVVARELRNLQSDVTVVDALGRSASADPFAQVRLTSVESLRSIGSDRAIQHLRHASTSEHPDTRTAAQQALTALGQR